MLAILLLSCLRLLEHGCFTLSDFMMLEFQIVPLNYAKLHFYLNCHSPMSNNCLWKNFKQ